jgi:hypothetical protein
MSVAPGGDLCGDLDAIDQHNLFVNEWRHIKAGEDSGVDSRVEVLHEIHLWLISDGRGVHRHSHIKGEGLDKDGIVTGWLLVSGVSIDRSLEDLLHVLLEVDILGEVSIGDFGIGGGQLSLNVQLDGVRWTSRVIKSIKTKIFK